MCGRFGGDAEFRVLRWIEQGRDTRPQLHWIGLYSGVDARWLRLVRWWEACQHKLRSYPTVALKSNALAKLPTLPKW